MAFDIKKLSNREKALVGVLILTLSTIPFFQFTLPSWKNYTDSSNKITENKKRLSELNLRIRKLEKLKFENKKIQRKVEYQRKYLAKSYEIDFLVQDLKSLCDESSISLESFTPTSSEPVNIVLEKQLEAERQAGSLSRTKLKQALEKLKEQDLPIDLYRFPIEVRVAGNFTEILELFKKLETYGRVISVENISIGKLQTKEGLGDRLSRSKGKKEKLDKGSLLGIFNLVAYSLPIAEETLQVKQLERTLGTPKSTFRFKKSR